jgi:hypothetical protein
MTGFRYAGTPREEFVRGIVSKAYLKKYRLSAKVVKKYLADHNEGHVHESTIRKSLGEMLKKCEEQHVGNYSVSDLTRINSVEKAYKMLGLDEHGNEIGKGDEEKIHLPDVPLVEEEITPVCEFRDYMDTFFKMVSELPNHENPEYVKRNLGYVGDGLGTDISMVKDVVKKVKRYLIGKQKLEEAKRDLFEAEEALKSVYDERGSSDEEEKE